MPESGAACFPVVVREADLTTLLVKGGLCHQLSDGVKDNAKLLVVFLLKIGELVGQVLCEILSSFVYPRQELPSKDPPRASAIHGHLT